MPRTAKSLVCSFVIHFFFYITFHFIAAESRINHTFLPPIEIVPRLRPRWNAAAVRSALRPTVHSGQKAPSPWFQITALTLVYSESAYSPSSRPIPLCLNPPKGTFECNGLGKDERVNAWIRLASASHPYSFTQS